MYGRKLGANFGGIKGKRKEKKKRLYDSHSQNCIINQSEIHCSAFVSYESQLYSTHIVFYGAIKQKLRYPINHS